MGINHKLKWKIVFIVLIYTTATEFSLIPCTFVLRLFSVIDLIILQLFFSFLLFFSSNFFSSNKNKSSAYSKMYSFGKDFQKTAGSKMNEIQNVKIIPHQKEIGKPSKDTLIEAEIIGTSLNKDLETQLGPAEYQYTEETAVTKNPKSSTINTFSKVLFSCSQSFK